MDRSGGVRSDKRFGLSWTLSPQERKYLRGTGEVAYARKIGFALAVAAAATCAAMSLVSFPPGFVLAIDPRLELAAAGLYFVLGVLVRLGKGWASLGLMALISASVGIPTLAAYRMTGAHYGDHAVFWMCRAVVGVAGWTLCMRLFWVGYRLERQAAALAG